MVKRQSSQSNQILCSINCLGAKSRILLLPRLAAILIERTGCARSFNIFKIINMLKEKSRHYVLLLVVLYSMSYAVDHVWNLWVVYEVPSFIYFSLITLQVLLLMMLCFT